MATSKQKLGDFGELLIQKNCSCPKCKKQKTLKKLPPNFKCADIICDFCGFVAQVKTSTVKDINSIPNKIPGAAWAPQRDRMEAGIYTPLYLVLYCNNTETHSAFYLSADLQMQDMFEPRKPLSSSAKRAGWQGFHINLKLVKKFLARIL